MSKKKKKRTYDKTTTLAHFSFSREYEPLIKDLYAKACQGSKYLWSEIQSPESLRNNDELRKEFFSAANRGMMSAQEKIISILENENEIEPQKMLLFRGVIDAIAWQILGKQLAFARRFFKSTVQPSLYNSNFKSVVSVANSILNESPNSVVLISDLTSFIQVGDLLLCKPDEGITIAEVKDGAINKKICNFVESYLQSPCPRSLVNFIRTEGEQTAKQLQRVIRQADRMAHISSILNDGHGIDPDTNQPVNIPEPFYPVQNWDLKLNRLLQESESKGWAIDTVDNCLFLGAYSKDEMLATGHVAFNLWFDAMGGTPECPRARLIDCMLDPLALPIFSRNIHDNYKFDLLFGRKQVCIGICVELFLDELKKNGFSIRLATNKECGHVENSGVKPYKHKGKAIFIGNGKTETILMDGIFLRIIFHAQTPISIAKTIFDSQDDLK